MSWDQLLSIIREYKSSVENEEWKETEDNFRCPNDGELLMLNRKTGELRCPFDGWPISDVTE